MRVFHNNFIRLSLLTLALVAAPRAGFAALTISEIASQTTFTQSSAAQTGNILVYLTATGSDITNDLFAGSTASVSISPASGSGITFGKPTDVIPSAFAADYPYIYAGGAPPSTAPYSTGSVAYVTANPDTYDANTGVEDTALSQSGPATGQATLMVVPFTVQPNATGVFTVSLDQNVPGNGDLLALSLLDPNARPYPDSLPFASLTTSAVYNFNTTPTFGPALTISVVPEPSTLLLAALAAGGGMFWECRRRRTSHGAA